MNIQSVNFVHASQTMSGPHRNSAPASSSTSLLVEADQLDISASAELASHALDAPAIRTDRVAQIRASIEAGNYDSDEKLSMALDRLLGEIA